VRAAEAGKHVLCEKPLSATAMQARTMFEAARKQGICLVEAYPYRAQQQTLKLRELLEAGAVGRVQMIQGQLRLHHQNNPNIRLNPALAGGALMDAGSTP